MPKTASLLETGGMIADLDGLPGRLVPSIVRRVRHLDTNGLLPTYREETGRREGRLDCEGACLARLFMVLLDFGFDIGSIQKIRADISNFRGAEPGPGMQGLPIAISEITAGKDRDLVITLFSNRSSGEKYFGVKVVGEDIPKPSKRVSDALGRRADSENISGIACLVVPLGPLFSPVIAHFAEA